MLTVSGYQVLWPPLKIALEYEQMDRSLYRALEMLPSRPRFVIELIVVIVDRSLICPILAENCSHFFIFPKRKESTRTRQHTKSVRCAKQDISSIR